MCAKWEEKSESNFRWEDVKRMWVLLEAGGVEETVLIPMNNEGSHSPPPPRFQQLGLF